MAEQKIRELSKVAEHVAMRDAIRLEKLSKRKAIQTLARQGMEVKDIANALGIRYQHVYNTVLQLGGPGRSKEALEKRQEALLDQLARIEAELAGK